MFGEVLQKIGLVSEAHAARSASATGAQTSLIALVGSPNVGKSVMFGNLTGTYVTV